MKYFTSNVKLHWVRSVQVNSSFVDYFFLVRSYALYMKCYGYQNPLASTVHTSLQKRKSKMKEVCRSNCRHSIKDLLLSLTEFEYERKPPRTLRPFLLWSVFGFSSNIHQYSIFSAHIEKLLDFEVFLSENVHKFFNLISKRVRLNYATTHHQPKYIYRHPPPAKTYLPPHTTTQKMDHHSIKAKICSYITAFRHCFNTFFFNEMQYSSQWRRFCVIKFWSVAATFLLHSFRSSHQRCSVKKDVLRNFAKFIEKRLCQCLFFKKVIGHQLYWKRLRHRCFPTNFEKFQRTPF